MLGLTTAAGVHGPVCLVFSSHSQSCPKGTANNGKLTSLFTCVTLHKWPNSSAAQKLWAQWSLGKHREDRAPQLCFLVKLQIKAWLTQGGCFSLSKKLELPFFAALEIFRFDAKLCKMAREAALIPLHSKVVAAAWLQ